MTGNLHGVIALLVEPPAERLKHLEQFIHRLFAVIRVGVHLLLGGPLEPSPHDLRGILLKDVTDDSEFLLVGRMPFT